MMAKKAVAGTVRQLRRSMLDREECERGKELRTEV